MEQLLNKKKKKKKRAQRTLPWRTGDKEWIPPHRPTTETEDNIDPSSDFSSKTSLGTSHTRGSTRDKRFDEFQNQLNALKLQQNMNKLGVVRPYPVEWDIVPYPAKFNPISLVQFDGNGSPSQHIYYFMAQTGFLTGNDAILTRLFIGTLKGVAFEWFRKLEPDSIKL